MVVGTKLIFDGLSFIFLAEADFQVQGQLIFDTSAKSYLNLVPRQVALVHQRLYQ